MNLELNRRNFLFGSAAATVLAGCATNRLGLRPLKAGEKRTVALIGFGKQQKSALMKQFFEQKGVEIVAVCDCDRERCETGVKLVNEHYKFSKCRGYADFRDILRDPSIDMVSIATPDHWHAYMCVEAMKRGKDVYCEKPLTFNVDESRKVIAAQEKYARVFQTGAMQRSSIEFRTACMVVRNGCIGELRYVDANFGGPSCPSRFFDKPEGSKAEHAPNPSCDWDMWLGPARWRPYSDKLSPRGMHDFYPMFWRFDDDLAIGMNGDWGAHHLDIAQWGMGMDESGPFRVIASEETAYSEDPRNGCRRQSGTKMLFKGKGGVIELEHGSFGTWGTVFYGTNGIVAVNRGKIAVWHGTGLVKPTGEIRRQIADATFLPEKLVTSSTAKDPATGKMVGKGRLGDCLKLLAERFALDTAPVQLYRSRNQVQNFVECVETRQPTISPAEVGGRSAILCQLCNMSYVYDTGFDWDPVKMDFANGTGHGISLKRDYCRNGFEVVV